MRNKVYKVPIVFFLLLIFISIPVYAKSEQSEVPVTFCISEDNRYDLMVKVSGDGSVYDGSKRIKNGTIVHRLRVSEEKIFRIIPERGSGIKRIYWKNEDTNLGEYYRVEDISNGKKLSLKGISTNSELIIEFERKDNLGKDKNDSQINGDSFKIPKTGDEGIIQWISILILSLIIMLMLYSQKNVDKK